MNYTQNEKIEQATDTTLVVGVDIGSQTHYARALITEGASLQNEFFHFRMISKDLIPCSFGQKS